MIIDCACAYCIYSIVSRNLLKFFFHFHNFVRLTIEGSLHFFL